MNAGGNWKQRCDLLRRWRSSENEISGGLSSGSPRVKRVVKDPVRWGTLTVAKLKISAATFSLFSLSLSHSSITPTIFSFYIYIQMAVCIADQHPSKKIFDLVNLTYYCLNPYYIIFIFMCIYCYITSFNVFI